MLDKRHLGWKSLAKFFGPSNAVHQEHLHLFESACPWSMLMQSMWKPMPKCMQVLTRIVGILLRQGMRLTQPKLQTWLLQPQPMSPWMHLQNLSNVVRQTALFSLVAPKSNVLEMINLQLQGTKGWSFWWASPENTEAWGVPRSTTNASSDKHWHEPLRARRLPSEIRLQSWWCWWHGKVWHGVLWWSVSSWGWSMFGQRCKHVQDHGAAYVSSFSQRTRTERWWALAFGCTGRPAWTSEAGAFAGSTGPWCSVTYFKRFEHSICAHLARKAQFKGRSNMAEEIEVRCSWVCLVGARKRKPIQSCVWQYHFQSFANSFLGKTWKRKPCDGQPGR